MNYIDPQTGNVEYNADEQARMRNDRGVLHALPVSPEIEAEDKKAQERIKQVKRIATNLEKRKESAWTEAKLKILAEKGAHKRVSDKKDPKELDMPAGSIREDLARVEPVLFERLGEPREFIEDMNIILNGFENERLVIEGNEMQKLNEYGKKYMIGLLIQRHIFEQGFSIGVDSNNQPILRDETGGSDVKRQEQIKGLKEALGQFEFSSHVRHILKKNDNSSLVAEYIAASTYEKHPNLVDYRNSLARKMGITSPDISPEQAQNITESTTLSPEEKSFLLAWKDSRKDTVLTQVQKQQETFVKYAQENIDKQTPETHLKELAERPFSKSAQLLAGGAIGAALLYFAYKQIKKGGVWGTISGIIAGLIGGSIMLPLGDKAWKALGMSDSLKNLQEGKPVSVAEASDHPFANFDTTIIVPVQTNWAKFQARLAGGQEGIEILMNKDVGQNIASQYPVYSMLNSLDPNSNTPSSKYTAPDETIPGADIKSIKAALEKLQKEPNQKAQLNTLLKDTWERYKKTTKYKGQNEKEQKTTNLADMLAEIEREDGWFTKAIDTVSDEPEKQKALKVIGQNPTAWGEISLEDIKKYFFNDPGNPGVDWRNNHPMQKYIAEYNAKKAGSNAEGVLLSYFKMSIDDIKKGQNSTKLRDFLLKS